MAQPVVAAVPAATGLTPVEAESPNAERIDDLYWFVSFWPPPCCWRSQSRWRSSSSATGAGADRTVEGPSDPRLDEAGGRLDARPGRDPLFVVAFTFYKLPGITLEDEARASDLRIRVEGRQFYWQYRYPNGVIAIDRLVASRTGLLSRSRHPRATSTTATGSPRSAASSTRSRSGRWRRRSRHAGLDLRGPVRSSAASSTRDVRRSKCCRPRSSTRGRRDQARRQEAGTSELGEQIFEGACSEVPRPGGPRGHRPRVYGGKHLRS